MGKSVFILRFGLCETVFVEDGELIHGAFPVVGGTTPVGRDVAQCEPDELGCCIVAGEMSSRFDDFAQSCVYALDGIGTVFT